VPGAEAEIINSLEWLDLTDEGPEQVGLWSYRQTERREIIINTRGACRERFCFSMLCTRIDGEGSAEQLARKQNHATMVNVAVLILMRRVIV